MKYVYIQRLCNFKLPVVVQGRRFVLPLQPQTSLHGSARRCNCLASSSAVEIMYMVEALNDEQNMKVTPLNRVLCYRHFRKLWNVIFKIRDKDFLLYTLLLYPEGNRNFFRVR